MQATASKKNPTKVACRLLNGQESWPKGSHDSLLDPLLSQPLLLKDPHWHFVAILLKYLPEVGF